MIVADICSAELFGCCDGRILEKCLSAAKQGTSIVMHSMAASATDVRGDIWRIGALWFCLEDL